MSFVLLMIYWVFLPFLVFRVARWLFRRAGSVIGKGLVVAVTVGLFAWFLWVAIGENMYWDAEVRELCAKDGGVRVYETVILPTELYDYYAARNWVLPDKSRAKPSDEYYFEREVFKYHKDDPQVTRTQTRIIRRNDSKVLGEYIRYGRGGGDLPGPWHGSSFSCADIVRPPSFATSIFIRRGNNEYNN